VCYIREGDVISCITKVGWWRNLRGGVPVTVCVKGQDLKGTADTVVDDQETIARVMGQLLEAARRPQYYAVPAGPDGRATQEELHEGGGVSRC